MMTNVFRLEWAAGLCIFVMLIFLTIDTVARGGGGGPGGGGYSRSSAASHGSMRGRSSSSSRSIGTRPDRSSTRRDKPSTRRDKPSTRRDKPSTRSDRAVKEQRYDRRDARRDIHEERHDWHDDRRRRRAIRAAVVGTSLTIASWNTLSCTRTRVIVNRVIHYTCGGAWYRIYYGDGYVTYVVVNTPPGY